MAFVTFFTRDRVLEQGGCEGLASEHFVLRVATWSKLLWVVRERPTTCVVIDGGALPRTGGAEALADLRRRFPSVATVLVTRQSMDATMLFRMGRAGLSDVVLLGLDGAAGGAPRAVRRALTQSTASVVVRVVSPSLPKRELHAVRLCLEAVQRGWSAEDVARRAELSRAHLSVRLGARGLPSTGRLVTWCRMLHAARWLQDPGRTAESVGRQLDYANGAVFRRALRSYLGGTPTEVREWGGLTPALERFVEACDLEIYPRALLGSVA